MSWRSRYRRRRSGLATATPGFCITDGKFFAYFRENHHGDGVTAVVVKATDLDEQAMLIEMDPDTYFRAAYLAHAGWVGMRLDQSDVDWDLVADRIARSWELVAPRRLLEAGGR